MTDDEDRAARPASARNVDSALAKSTVVLAVLIVMVALAGLAAMLADATLFAP